MANKVQDKNQSWVGDLSRDLQPIERQTHEQVAKEFCQETSFHGIKYFVRKDFSVCKRLFWILYWLCSLGVCAFCITTNVIEYFHNPTITSIDSTNYPISKVDFPVVTFCSFNRVAKNRHPPSQVDVLGSKHFTEEEWYRMTAGVYRNLLSSDHVEELHNASTLNLAPHQAYCVLKQSAQQCDDMVRFCQWRGSEDCSDQFTQITTRDGFCCAITVKNQTLAGQADHCPREKSKPKKWRKHTWGHLSRGSVGVNQGLTVLLDAEADQYSFTNYHSIGFKLGIQEPGNLQGLGHEGVMVLPGREVFVPMQAYSTFTTSRALHLPANKRRCYTDNDLELRYAKGPYCHDACVLDHQTVSLLEECGCRLYYMPGTATYCVYQDQIGCVRDFTMCHRNDTRMERISQSCYPACNLTRYQAVLSFTDLPAPYMERTSLALKFLYPMVKDFCQEGFIGQENTTSFLADPCSLKDEEDLEHLLEDDPAFYQIITDYIRKNLALVHVYFELPTATRYKRDVVTTPCQFIANIGGLLGLFLGFSMLSGAEILFYFGQFLTQGGRRSGGAGGGRKGRDEGEFEGFDIKITIERKPDQADFSL